MPMINLKLNLMGLQGPSNKCDRCGLSHFVDLHDMCPHCSDLDFADLQLLLEQQTENTQSVKTLGQYMLVGVIVVLMLMVIFI